MPSQRPHLLILGGGLSGGLAALALAKRRPEISVQLVEAGDRLGGNHLWSFFDSDIADENRDLVEPLVARHWDRYEVRFPAHRRTLATGYSSVTSEKLDTAVRSALAADAIIRGKVVAASPADAMLEDGRSIEADAVLDMRGFDAVPDGLVCGWQKFVGQMLEIDGGHGLEAPIIMDAKVDQTDGYRFVYCLPFDATRVFVEDTYYQDSPELDRDLLRSRIKGYAAARGWSINDMSREEQGVLPVVKGGDFDAFWPARDPLARGGVTGGFFQPLTSYSLPEAVRFAGWLAEAMPMNGTDLAKAARARAQAHWKRTGFERLLARMLFDAANPAQRYRILERFYQLPESLIGRFYAGTMIGRDRFRILAGRPPVAIHRAIAAMLRFH